MKIKILIILFFTLNLISCDNYNLEIDPEYRTAINSYRINDTIYFQSEKTPLELDTIRISKIDSIRQVPVIGNVLPNKKINLKIEHLPINNWKEIQLYGDPNSPELQLLISVNNVSENCCYFDIEFRDFKSYSDRKLKNNYRQITDTLLHNGNHRVLTGESVIELYFNYEQGVVGYKKNNGEIYRIKNAP